jgi:hypothetical protein
MARECGLVGLGTIAVDGTKVKASASRHKAMSYQRMLETEVQLKSQIAALLKKARSTDAAEKSEPELDIPAEIERRNDRLESSALHANGSKRASANSTSPADGPKAMSHRARQGRQTEGWGKSLWP